MTEKASAAASSSLLSVLTQRLAAGPRHANDRSTFAELNVAHGPDRLPPGLTLEWLGTAGFDLAYKGFHLLIDPFVTRPSLLRTFSPAALRSSQRLVAKHVPQASAVLVGHTHFDHAMDVPAISRATGCNVYGSSSLVRLMQLHGLADRATEVDTQRVYEIGPFEITFIDSAHAKLLAGLKVPFEGELSCDNLDQLRGTNYTCGRVLAIHIRVAGVTFYHQGSADLLDERVVHRGVDYFLAGIAGRGFAHDYAGRILRKLEPRVTIAHHLDDFFRPLGEDMGFSFNVNLGGFVEEVRRVSADFAVRTLEPLQRWEGDRQ